MAPAFDAFETTEQAAAVDRLRKVRVEAVVTSVHLWAVAAERRGSTEDARAADERLVKVESLLAEAEQVLADAEHFAECRRRRERERIDRAKVTIRAAVASNRFTSKSQIIAAARMKRAFAVAAVNELMNERDIVHAEGVFVVSAIEKSPASPPPERVRTPARADGSAREERAT